jgi:hypothetical protein
VLKGLGTRRITASAEAVGIGSVVEEVVDGIGLGR